MKKSVLLKSILMLAMVCAFSAEAGAQDLKSILGDVAKAVVGDKATTASSIVGTWTYVSPECQFESEQLLAKAGGEVVAKNVEEKLQVVYGKVGVDNIQYTFNENGTYSYTLKKRTVNGTYVFDEKEKTVTMKGKLGIKTVAHVTVVGSNLSLVFDADKLMSVLKTITGAVSKLNATASAINDAMGNYDGLMLGFELKKQ